MNEITMNLDASAKMPMYEQIYQYIKTEIQKQHIKSQERLPSTRALAAHLQVSRSTVDLAYEQLLSEGYIVSIPCKGYYVSQIDGLYDLKNTERIAEKNYEVEREEEKQEYLVDFKTSGIDSDSFPYNTWRKLSKSILLDHEKELYTMGDAKGEWELRTTISRYLHQSRGVECSAEQIVIGAGSEYLLFLISQMLGKAAIAMESPTYKQAYYVLKSLKHPVTMVPMDKDGLKVDYLEKSPASVAYVMPSHQFPLGIVMPLKRRMELLQWAGKSKERYIIEDDYDSEFRYKGKPIPALQGYDRKDKVIYLGTFSRAIAPAIRISYMVLPKSLMEVFQETCGVYSSTVSRIDQIIVNDFITEGYFERHLNKMRAVYRAKHDCLIAQLRNIPCCHIEGENAGMHMLLRMEPGRKEEEWIALAKQRGIKVYGLSEYYIAQTEVTDTKLILGYANLKEEDIVMACNILKKAWK